MVSVATCGSTRPGRRFAGGPIRAAGLGTPRRPGPAVRISGPPRRRHTDAHDPPPRTRPTLEEVAARAGVGRGTASRVINGGEKVSEKARQAVEDAIAELGYVPNAAARALVTRRTDAVALVIAESEERVFGEPFFAGIIRGIGSALGRGRPAAGAAARPGLAAPRRPRRVPHPPARRRRAPALAARRRRAAGADPRPRRSRSSSAVAPTTASAAASSTSTTCRAPSSPSPTSSTAAGAGSPPSPGPPTWWPAARASRGTSPGWPPPTAPLDERLVVRGDFGQESGERGDAHPAGPRRPTSTRSSAPTT